jgi:hypothetical protein
MFRNLRPASRTIPISPTARAECTRKLAEDTYCPRLALLRSCEITVTWLMQVLRALG